MSEAWMQTYTGKRFDLLAPQPSEIDILDIAHALSMQCRFTGHCSEFYSVAEHSICVSYLVPPEDAFSALMHDAAEAYISDISSPLKRLLPDYKRIELIVERAIATKFDIDIHRSSIKDADMAMLEAERRCMHRSPPQSWELPEMSERMVLHGWDMIMCHPSYDAEVEFMRRFNELNKDSH